MDTIVLHKLQELYSRREKHTFLVILYVLSTIYIIFTPFLKKLTSIDELIVLALAIYSISYFHIYKKKEIIITFSILFIYLGYSLFQGINKPVAAFFDFILFLKPFLCFFICQQLGGRTSKKTRTYLKYLYIFLGAYCFIILPYINILYSNTAAYYPACIMCAISYLYFSKRNTKDWIIALILLSPGLFSIRAKFFTEYVFFVSIAFFLKKKIHFNMKWIFIFSILVSISIYISWAKFSHYFLYGDAEETARTAIYVRSINVLKDYMPMGSGYGTFGTEAAAKYYSPLYRKYGLEFVWGLRQEDYGGTRDFLKDTFYPVLAQFGILGIIFYFVFWWRRWKESLLMEIELYKLFLIVFFIVSIQNIAANSFTSPTGVSYMMILGLLINKNTNSQLKIIITKDSNCDSHEKTMGSV